MNESRGVTRVVAAVLLALLVPTLGVLLAPPAHAVVTSEIDYTLAATDAQMSSPLGVDGNPCVDDPAVGTYYYKALGFVVTADGAYDFRDVGANEGRLGVYTGTFDPANTQTGCQAFFSENPSGSVTVNLTAGTVYTLVESTETSGATGAFSFDANGTGSVLFTTVTTLTTSPNPSELSKATTLTATVTGGNDVPTGTVQFKDGATVLGTSPVSASGVATLSVKTLSVGDHTLTATYAGDADHATSTGTKVHKVKYGPKPKLKLSISDKAVTVGDKVKLTWVATNADTIKASGDWKGSKPKKGSAKVKIKTLGVHIFKLKASNVNGADKAKVKVVATRPAKEFTVSVPDLILTAGSKVRVKAAKLDAKERFKVFLDDALLSKGFADGKGLVSALVTLPKAAEEGEHVLTVMGSNEDRAGEIDVVVIKPTKVLGLELAKDSVKVGKTNTVTVSGLVEGEDVTLMYQGDVLAEGVGDADGEFEFTFPVGTEPGPETVTAIGHVPGRKGEVSFTVTPAGGTGL